MGNGKNRGFDIAKRLRYSHAPMVQAYFRELHRQVKWPLVKFWKLSLEILEQLVHRSEMQVRRVEEALRGEQCIKMVDGQEMVPLRTVLAVVKSQRILDQDDFEAKTVGLRDRTLTAGNAAIWDIMHNVEDNFDIVHNPKIDVQFVVTGDQG